MTEGVTGVVLAGGKSSRFGSNKAVAPWRGQTLTGSAVRRLCDIFPRVLVVGKNPELVAGLNDCARFVSDDSEQSHPLVGIVAALRDSETDRIFVTACDMPLVDPALIRAVCDASSGYAVTTALWDGHPQPLFGVYSKECLGVMRLLLKEKRPVRELFNIVRTRFLSQEEIADIDPAGRSFLDIDTPEDYLKVQRSAHA